MYYVTKIFQRLFLKASFNRGSLCCLSGLCLYGDRIVFICAMVWYLFLYTSTYFNSCLIFFYYYKRNYLTNWLVYIYIHDTTCSEYLKDETRKNFKFLIWTASFLVNFSYGHSSTMYCNVYKYIIVQLYI